jgi:hypothetical protein
MDIIYVPHYYDYIIKEEEQNEYERGVRRTFFQDNNNTN